MFIQVTAEENFLSKRQDSTLWSHSELKRGSSLRICHWAFGLEPFTPELLELSQAHGSLGVLVNLDSVYLVTQCTKVRAETVLF